MKAKTELKLNVRRIASFKRPARPLNFWETDPITTTTVTVTHITIFNK
jgi:hypothetical protein